MDQKRIACAGLALIMMLGALPVAGCTVSNTERVDSTVSVEENKDAEVHITVGTLMTASEKNLMQTWINKYQQLHSNVSIEITKTYNSMPEIINYASTNTMPDIVWTAGDQHAAYSDPERLNYFQDLSDETKFEGSKEFYSGFYDEIVATTHYRATDTGNWFVPRDYNRLVIYYNKTIFDNFGIATPKDDWTWDEFIETCQQLKDKGCKSAIEWRNWAPVHSTMVKNFGASYVDENGYFAFDSEEGEACYNWYKDEWIGKLAVSGEGGNFGSYSATYAKSPKAAMLVDTYANLGSYMDRAKKNNWECDVAAFPNYVQADGSAGYVGTGCSGYAITTSCTDEETRTWAWKFLKWCMSEDGYNEVASLGVLCPALKSMRNSGEWTNYTLNGKVINYRAFVNTNTNDLDLNYQNVLSSTYNQDLLVSYALTFWNSAYATPYAEAIKDFKSNYESGTGIKKK